MLARAVIFLCMCMLAVQSQDTNQVVLQERELWQKEKAALVQELEQARRDVLLATPSRGSASPPKSPTPNDEDTDLEISMTKVKISTVTGSIGIPIPCTHLLLSSPCYILHAEPNARCALTSY